jgi:hypothetical protein
MQYQKVYVQEEIEADANSIWQLIRDFSEISAWGPGEVVKTEGLGVGMIRHINFNSEMLVERCEAHNDDQMSFSYRLLESPWPIADYVAIVVLTPEGPNKTLIEWSSVYQSTSESTEATEATRKFIENTYRKGFIARLRKNATK